MHIREIEIYFFFNLGARWGVYIVDAKSLPLTAMDDTASIV